MFSQVYTGQPLNDSQQVGHLEYPGVDKRSYCVTVAYKPKHVSINSKQRRSGDD
jgi:hypothetical protein